MSTAITLRSHLEGEVTRLHKSRRNLSIAGTLIILVVLIYTSWLYSFIHTVTKPQNLVALVSGMVEAQIPSWKHSISSTLEVEAPALAKHLGRVLRNDVPAQMKAAVETGATEAATAVAKEAAKTYREALAEVIQNAKAEVAEAVAAPNDEQAAAALFQAVQKHMDAAMRKTDEHDLAAEGLFVKLEQAGKTLVRLNQKLTKYANTDDAQLSEKDRKTKRFLSTFWRYMQQEYPDAKTSPTEPAAPKK